MRVLLTATVSPNTDVSLRLVDPDERRRQYVAALRRWLAFAKASGAEIVLAENSGADLLEIIAEAGDPDCRFVDPLRVERPDAAVLDRGKGAAEASLIDAFIERYTSDGDDEFWIKCTGRLWVRHPARILPAQRSRDYMIARVRADFGYVDTRLVGGAAGVWRRHFRYAGKAVDDRDGRYLEHVFALRLLEAMASGVELRRFCRRPTFVGSSGSSGSDYSLYSVRVKEAISSQAERLLRSQRFQQKFY